MCGREGEYKIQTKLTNNGRERKRKKEHLTLTIFCNKSFEYTYIIYMYSKS